MKEDIILSLQGTMLGNSEEHDKKMLEIVCRYLYVVGDKTKQRWRAINKITMQLYGSLEYKEMVRKNLNTLVKENLIMTRPSCLPNDKLGTVKYCITEAGEKFLSNND